MSEAEFLQHEPCPKCGSRNNLARYTDGHGYCFGCEYYEPGDQSMDDTSAPRERKDTGLVSVGEPSAWDGRSITLESAKKWGFTRSELNGETVRIFNYRDTNQRIVAQKIRFKGKDFRFIGDTANCGLYGMHLWRDGGRRVIVTEGELDAISVSQMQNHKWPVVSVPTGAKGAKKALQKNLEWLNGFDEVILMFDMDEPGREAVDECMGLFEPGKCKVAILPRKDPNEMLMEREIEAFTNCIFGAKVLRPDGIVDGRELFDVVSRDDVMISTSLPFQGLQGIMRGVRIGEVVTLTAGSGIGKSAIVREIAYHLISIGETVGMMMLEEDTRRTALGLMGIAASKPLHLDKSSANAAEFKEAFDRTLGSGRVFLYDHFGSTEVDNLLAKVRYLAKGCDCRWVILDHLSIVISGQDEGDERRLIDNTMTALKALAMECGIGIFLVSHLKRPSGDKGHEQGAETSLSQLRGSHSIAQLSDFVIGLERNQQNVATINVEGKTYTLNNITTLRVLKNRFTGETGPGGWLLYDRDTGRLRELLEDPYAMKDKGSDAPSGDDDTRF
ncbi:MAG: DnaB-like helicase C-terminal domain-containing protein [Pararhizobium sp.]